MSTSGHEANFSNRSTDFRCGIPPSLPSTVPRAVDYVYAAVVLAIIILSLSLNGFVVFLVATHKSLREKTLFLSLQINVSHLVFTLSVLVFVVASAVADKWLLGDIMCQIMGLIQHSAISLRFFLMLVLALDRVFTVFMPFHYDLRYGTRVAIGMSAAAWVISIFRVILPVEGILNCYTYVPAFSFCSVAPSCSRRCAIFAYTVFSTAVLLGGIIPFVLYVVLFCKARRLQRRMRRQSVCSYNINSSNKTEFSSKQEHEWRALITFFILFVSLLGCSLPSFVLFVLTFALQQSPHPAVIILQKLVGRTLMFTLTVIDPIAIMRNQDIRLAVRTTKLYSCLFRQCRTKEWSINATSTTIDLQGVRLPSATHANGSV